MSGEDPNPPALPRLVSVPGLVAVAVFGFAVMVVSWIFGPGHILREIVTEMLASFGSTILVLAAFGLVFRSGLEHLLRRAPGGEAFARSADRLGELLQDLDLQEQRREAARDAEKLDRIDESLRSLTTEEIPGLRTEIEGLRRSLANAEHRRNG